jgi:membrane-associated protease RseP (regulator of RpoE activity)
LTQIAADTHRPAEPPAPRDGSGSLPALLAALGALIVVSVVLDFWKTLAVVSALFLMIMLHELGHFVMARRGGMKVTEFFVGMGPRIWSIRRGEVEYGVKALPIGGYVKIIGMNNLDEVPEPDEPRAYRQKGFWPRMGVAVAGSTVHMLLALGLFFTLNAVTGNPARVQVKPVISEISGLDTGETPAAAAGLRLGDRIVAVDDVRTDDWDVIRSYVAARPKTPIRMAVVRGTEELTLVVTPAERTAVPATSGTAAKTTVPPKSTGFIGIGATRVDPRVNPLAAVGRSFADLGTTAKGTVTGLGKLVTFQGIKSYKDQLAGKPVTKGADPGPRFLSPVGLVHVAGSQADDGIASVLLLLALINVFVGLFNMIPLLPFDGGHVSVAVYEEIRAKLQGGRRYMADVGKLLPLAYLTVAVLAFIGISSLYLDIARPIPLQ